MADQQLSTRTGNRILSALSRPDFLLLEAHLQPVTLKFQQRLEASGRKVRGVYFIESGLVSAVGVGGAERREAEVCVIGREGLTGLPVILGVDRSPIETVVQVKGRAQCIAADALRQAIDQSSSLRSWLLRYVHLYVVQIGHTAIANARGKIEERLARWLLMAHDRSDGDALALTHEFLALILGVRRAGVTAALNELEAKALISTKRGCITIADRQGLEAAANGLYGVPEAEFKRLLPG
jgi:CRP-like cAMP-binding protein